MQEVDHDLPPDQRKKPGRKKKLEDPSKPKPEKASAKPKAPPKPKVADVTGWWILFPGSPSLKPKRVSSREVAAAWWPEDANSWVDRKIIMEISWTGTGLYWGNEEEIPNEETYEIWVDRMNSETAEKRARKNGGAQRGGRRLDAAPSRATAVHNRIELVGGAMPAQKFIKKPVVIEAFLWSGYEEDLPDLLEWMHHPYGVSTGRVDLESPLYHISIVTLEGTTIASPGDWIIKGVAGEFYPRKPDIFFASYEAV